MFSVISQTRTSPAPPTFQAGSHNAPSVLVLCSALAAIYAAWGIQPLGAQTHCPPDTSLSFCTDQALTAVSEDSRFSGPSSTTGDPGVLTWQFVNNGGLDALAGDAITGGNQYFADTSFLYAGARHAIHGGVQSFRDDSTLLASAEQAIVDGTQFFFGTSTLQAQASYAIDGGVQMFMGRASLVAEHANAISSGEQHFNGTTLTASRSHAITGGTQDFDAGTLEAHATSAIAGGTQTFRNGSMLTTLNGVDYAINGGEQHFYGSTLMANARAIDSGTQTFSADDAFGAAQKSWLLAQDEYAILDGRQYFYDDSELAASANNAIVGGEQHFLDDSLLTASAIHAINGGIQTFSDTSLLVASVANAITNGQQRFYDDSLLFASATNAVNGGTQYLLGGSELVLGAAYALSESTRIRFGYENVADPHGGTLTLNGHDTHVYTIGHIFPDEAAGVIRNGSATIPSTLTIGSNNLPEATSIFHGTIDDGAGAKQGGTLAVELAAGTLYLSGDNAFSGGLTLQDDTWLNAPVRSLGIGDIRLGSNSVLELTDTEAATLDMTLAGHGTIRKTSDSTLTIISDGSEFYGETLVERGRLIVGVKNIGSLGGDIQVRPGATLAGTGEAGGIGSIVTIQAGAALAPGNSIGTLRIGGDLTLDAGATFIVEANDQGQADRVIVNGDASLNGRLQVIAQGAHFQPRTDYTIIEASQVSGAFNAVDVNYTFLTPVVIYHPQDVVLRLERKASPPLPPEPTTPPGPQPTPEPPPEPAPSPSPEPVPEPAPVPEPGPAPQPPPPPEPAPLPPPVPAPTLPPEPVRTPMAFRDAAHTPNQRAIAEAAESLPDTHALYRRIETLPMGAAPAVFQALNGSIHANVASLLRQPDELSPAHGVARLRDNLHASQAPGDAIALAGTVNDLPSPDGMTPHAVARPIWLEVVGGHRRQVGNANADAWRARRHGVVAGADFALSPDSRVGMSVGYLKHRLRLDERRGQADIASLGVGLTAGHRAKLGAGTLSVLAGLSHTWHTVNTRRSLGILSALATGSPSQQAQAQALGLEMNSRYRAQTTEAYAEAAYTHPLGLTTQLEPYVGLAWQQLRRDGFTETGGLAALQGHLGHDSTLSSTLGVRLHQRMNMAGGMQADLSASLGWRRAYGTLASTADLSFDGSRRFAVQGTPLARNSAVLGVQAQLQVSRHLAIGLDYQGQLGGGMRDHAGQVRASWRF